MVYVAVPQGRCLYCGPLAPHKMAAGLGALAACGVDACPSVFHVTCARACGAVFSAALRQRPVGIYVTCTQHEEELEQEREGASSAGVRVSFVFRLLTL